MSSSTRLKRAKAAPINCGRRLRRRLRLQVHNRSTKPGRSIALRRGRFSEDYGCYFITKCTLYRRPVLATPTTAQILTDSWTYLRTSERLKLFAFCIMPDHFHMTLCLMPGENLSKLFEDSGKFTARQLNLALERKGQFWEEGFRDRRCRNESELHDLCVYIEHNPVRAGLVERAEQWPYSSAFPQNNSMLDREWWP
jgi:putative transposase